MREHPGDPEVQGMTHAPKLRVVKAKGGPPVNRPCSQTFWDGIRRIMNTTYGSDYTTFQGPLMAYRNALKKVDDLR